MKTRRLVRYFVVIIVVLMTVGAPAALVQAMPAKKKGRRPFIIDYQRHLNKRFKKVSRLSTQFIVIHTSEAGLTSTLRTLSRGKNVGRYRTIGGHTNYCIAREVLKRPYIPIKASVWITSQEFVCILLRYSPTR